MFDILAQIVAIAHVGSVNKNLLHAMCAVGHNTQDAMLKGNLALAYEASNLALASALAPFGVTPNEPLPGQEGERHPTTYGTAARVFGARTLA